LGFVRKQCWKIVGIGRLDAWRDCFECLNINENLT
jgi:hypothetical protein